MVLSGEHKIKRLTCDIDSLSKTRVYWAVFVFKIFGYKHDMTIRKSSSGNGRHIIGWCKHKGLSKNSHYIVRTLALDDPYRIKRDRTRGGIQQVLFTEKRRLK